MMKRTLRRRALTPLWSLLGIFILSPSAARADDPLAKPSAGKPADDLDALLEGRDQGLRIRLAKVGAPDEDLAQDLFWRSLNEVVGARTTPVEFRVDDAELIAPRTKTAEKEGQRSIGAEIVYPIEARVKLAAGAHVLQPGNITLQIAGGNPASKHPAIKIVEHEGTRDVLILCAPVRLEVVDTAGSAVPTPLRVSSGEKSLLRREATFSSLVIWLPVGGRYRSTLGGFSVSATGKVEAASSDLAPGVELTGAGLRKTVAAPLPTQPAASNVFSVREPIGNPAAFSVFVPPVVPVGQVAWLAVSKSKYAQATGRPFTLERLSAQWKLDGTLQTDVAAKLEAGLNPATDLANLAASELRVEPGDLAWVKLTVPPTLYGPVAFILRGSQTSSVEASTLVANLGDKLQVVPHRWRTAFAETETASYNLLIAGDFAASSGQAFVQSADAGSQPIAVGKLQLPSVEKGQFDSRLLRLAAGDLPTGQYSLWVEAGGQRSGGVPLRVVSWQRKSPFLVHSMSCCVTCWPTDDEGLARLHDAGMEMGTATGHHSLVDVEMPAADAALAARLAEWNPRLPAELAVRRAGNDYLLERMLRHEMRLIDLTVARGAHFYNEGLSYHHSYGPTVDRMVRRMQLFTQQTGDYASFWGVNYSWFPALGGYVEGGVPTDPHTADRNRVLKERVMAAGFTPLTPEQSKWLAAHKSSAETADREKVAALSRQATDYWRASQDQGFGRHNELYNAAVREVRPDIVSTLFDNAGHDAGKRTRALFNDMSAICYETYTDYGDWPMSCAFAVDWSRGNLPNKPVWLTTNWGSNAEGNAKSLFHAFARGLAGGGMPLPADIDPVELARRGAAMKFISQYGALAREATPDRRVAILSRTAKQALSGYGMWELHAIYYHLTRLGYAPALVSDEDVVASGVPAQTQALVLVNEEFPLEPESRAAIERFIAKGGKVLLAGKSATELPGSILVDAPLKHLWNLKGFQPAAHAEMWQEFEQHWRGPLSSALKQAGVEPLATTDVDQAFALTRDAGPVRYVVVIADAKESHSNDFQRPANVPLSLAGGGWVVRDLVKQLTLPSKTNGDRTDVSVDLTTEPTTLLACYKAAPSAIEIDLLASPRLGAELVFNSRVSAGDAKQPVALGATPLAFSLRGPDGRQRRAWFEAAAAEQSIALPAHDAPGKWQLTVQELLTGLTATAEISVAPADSQYSASQVADVHVVDESHLKKFATRTGEKMIVVEPGQQSLLPIAEQLTSSLAGAGVKTRLWQVRPEEFDTAPVRWYPLAEDDARQNLILAGRLIGYRGNLKAHIDKIKRVHVPELGGYAEIDPPYIVGQDCIIFSGGRLAESLRAVTPWMNAPHSPGREQGRLLVAFSPFMADRQAVAVIANDAQGMAKAAEHLAAAFNKPAAEKAAPQTAAKRAQPTKAPVKIAVKLETRGVASTYRNYSPEQRVQTLLATRSGKAALLLKGAHDNLALVDEHGKVTATAVLDEILPGSAQLDEQGRLHVLRQEVLASDPSWHFPSEVELLRQTIGPAGKVLSAMPVFRGQTATLPPDFVGGFRSSPDGATLIASRPAAVLFGKSGERGWRRYDDLPRVVRRYELLWPRVPVGAAYSPDGRYLVVTMDSRPPFGGLGSPAYQPTSSETILLDLEKNARVWALHEADYTKATYAAHTGFSAVAAGGKLTALAGFDGEIFLIDKRGAIVLRETIGSAPPRGRVGAPDGVGVSISDQGELAAFGFKSLLVLAHGSQTVRQPVAGLTSACVAHDGSLAVASDRSGQAQAFSPQGSPLWTLRFSGAGCQVAAVAENHTLIATGDGELILVDSAGKEKWRAKVAAAVDKQKHPLEHAADFAVTPGVPDYREPSTLAYAQEQLSAKQVSAWTPRGAAREAWGKKFYATDSPIELAAGKATESDAELFLHLVYRRPTDNRAVQVTVQDRDGTNTFELDLPTPNYRVVDLPLRGAGAKARLSADGPVEIAECSLWTFRWPSGNLAYIKPAGSGAEQPAKPKVESLVDDIAAELDNRPQAATGQMKDCKIYFPNPDVDQVAGPYLRPPLDPTQTVDGKRFEQGQLAPWAGQNTTQPPTRGAFLTVDFSKTPAPRLLATYDRATKQSQVCASVAVFTTDNLNPLTSGSVLVGASDNDQFWRLLPLPKLPPQPLGVHIFSGASRPVGLSEVEAYR